MKRTFLAVFITLAFIFTAQAQFTNNAKVISNGNNHCVIEWTGTLSDYGGTYASITSNSFSLVDYDAEPYFTYYTKFLSSDSLPKVTVILQRSEDNSTFTATTVSTDTLSAGDTTETAHWVAKTFGNARSTYYKLNVKQLDQVAGSSAGAEGTTFTIRFIAHKRDYAK